MTLNGCLQNKALLKYANVFFIGMPFTCCAESFALIAAVYI
uniref:Uncharacterized protein n=1 Tax=Siphoviridae sp. cti0B23 TaxID=2825619 RepID=A0A8S5UDT1_9CAUD|nr:MAG TPA: hypothetical protein [Siphoviridae sp. cti0B23]